MNSRRLYILGEINEELVKEFIKEFHNLVSQSAEKPIDIYINSEGGSWTDGMAIFSLIRRSPCIMNGIVLGSAQSMATVVLQACDHRVVDKDATIMLHDGTDGVPDETHARNLEKYAEQSKAVRERMYRIYSEKSNKDTAYWRRNITIDFFLNPEKALELGLVDEII